MVKVIKKVALLNNIRKALKGVEKKNKHLNDYKYCGTVKITDDAVLTQRKLQSECK